MKSAKKLWALLLAFVMVLSLAACGGSGDTSTPDTGDAAAEESDAADSEEADADTEDASGEESTAPANDTLVTTVEQGLDGKFSPFFGLSANDVTIWEATQAYTIEVDRVSNPIMTGIEGETREYNGTDYTYYTASDMVVTENEDGTVYYDITMRDDIKFTDGTTADIDDVIFAMYVYLDPTYDGNSTLFSTAIEGIEEYRSGIEPL